MESYDRSQPLFEQHYLTTVNLPLECPICRKKGTVSQTYVRNIPNDLGFRLGFKDSIEVISGSPSWQGDHSCCGYQW